MFQIQENFSLKNLNTFGVDVTARWYVEINIEKDLLNLISDPKWRNTPRLILGGGSNMLFTKNVDGLVIKMNINGIQHKVDGTDVIVTAGGGVVWNDLVNYCVNLNFVGIENLSLIPGSVGASPIQNIGAYGVELKDVFLSCKALKIETGSIRIFNLADCKFGYRDSIFKTRLRDKYIITEVSYKLSSILNPITSYGAIQDELCRQGITEPNVKDISQVVSKIRVSKLPDPSTVGNAGSFFKNPIISLQEFNTLYDKFPDIVNFPVGNSQIKLAAGWLIESCGWKGKIVGQTGTWKNQALVLINYGQATGVEIYNLSTQIIKSVEDRFNIVLEREVNIF